MKQLVGINKDTMIMPGVPVFPAFPDNVEIQHTIMSDMQKSIIKNMEHKNTFENIVKVYKEFRNKHIKYEEHMMLENGYPGLDSHKEAHNKICEVEDGLLFFGFDKNRVEYGFRVWKLHIITEDRMMMDYINGDGSFSSTDNGI